MYSQNGRFPPFVPIALDRVAVNRVYKHVYNGFFFLRGRRFLNYFYIQRTVTLHGVGLCIARSVIYPEHGHGQPYFFFFANRYFLIFQKIVPFNVGRLNWSVAQIYLIPVGEDPLEFLAHTVFYFSK